MVVGVGVVVVLDAVVAASEEALVSLESLWVSAGAEVGPCTVAEAVEWQDQLEVKESKKLGAVMGARIGDLPKRNLE